MAKETFEKAKKNKSDEFYTQMIDIENEIKVYLDCNPNVFKGKVILCPCDDPHHSNFFKYFVLNFNKLGVKKLISTCYSLPSQDNQIMLFSSELEESGDKIPYKIEITTVDDKKYDEINLTKVCNLIKNPDNILSTLNGDGDFRSEEVTCLRDEADFIITNPPFSLFRDFIKWINVNKKQFLIISNMNAITYKEVFPLIKDNQIWMGLGFGRSFKGFIVPSDYPLSGSETRIDSNGNKIVSTNNTIWLTNIDHNYRHKPLKLMSMEKNLSSSKYKKIRNKEKYDKYDNYDAIDVPFTEAIPSDYGGAMGVPISFLYKYCPDQFEIIKFRKGNDGKDLSIEGKCPYFRILIKNKMAII